MSRAAFLREKHASCDGRRHAKTRRARASSSDGKQGKIRPGKAAFYAGAGNFSAALSQGEEERIMHFPSANEKKVLLFDRPCV
jgi:hypothetical protein